VVVGVDGSAGSGSARRWAEAEAQAVGSHVEPVTVHHRHPENELLQHAEQARLLVVGKRGKGVIPRLLVGSTAVAVAGRAPVPVVVVPTDWRQEDHATEPIVVGLDPDPAHHRLLHLAFRRAERLGVPLVIVHGKEVHDDAPDVSEHFAEEVRRWRERFPQVEVRSYVTDHQPAMALLDEAESGAQMVVLGRRQAHRFDGFGFGSVTRAVLHYAEVPVLVVPVDGDL
jgi:nucleotide-binding universal stress UspA family protein